MTIDDLIAKLENADTDPVILWREINEFAVVKEWIDVERFKRNVAIITSAFVGGDMDLLIPVALSFKPKDYSWHLWDWPDGLPNAELRKNGGTPIYGLHGSNPAIAMCEAVLKARLLEICG